MEHTTSGNETIPAPELWMTPMSWVGTPLRDGMDYSRAIPTNAVFTRGEVIATVSRETGPGMYSERQMAVPALIRLERGYPIEVYWMDEERRRWTYRPVKRARKTVWTMFMGAEWPGTEECAPDMREQLGLTNFTVQSVLPMDGSRKHVSLSIDEFGKATRWADAVDEDPND